MSDEPGSCRRQIPCRSHFGWSSTYHVGSADLTGPLLAGYDPVWAPSGEGTCYNTAMTCANGATAAGAEDLFAIDGAGGAVAPGCYFFGGHKNPNGCGAVHKVPGAQYLFLVGLLGWDRTDRESFRRQSQDLVVKLSYTIRF